jgi:hypothetical protein
VEQAAFRGRLGRGQVVPAQQRQVALRRILFRLHLKHYDRISEILRAY